MSRNIFRESERAWAYDVRAQSVAKAVVDNSDMLSQIRALHPSYVYVLAHVFLHAEDIAVQRLGRDVWRRHVALYKDHADAKHYETISFFFDIHIDAVQRFGRFPSRNLILGRQSSQDEEDAMASGRQSRTKQQNPLHTVAWLPLTPV